MLELGWVVGLRYFVPMCDLDLWEPSVCVFLRDPRPYLLEFRRKHRKTLNICVGKRDWGLNAKPLICREVSHPNSSRHNF